MDMWANFHCHTTYCDGKKPVEEVVAAAIDQGMIAIGISSHAPLPFEKSWCMKSDRLADYLRDVRTAASSTAIQVYAGLEVDYIPGKTSPAIFQQQLDYTVGSVHFVDAFPEVDGEYRGWEIDGTFQLFADGLERIFHGDIRRAVSRYYELTREMLRTSAPDMVGHLDKIKMHNKKNLYFREEDTWYREQIIQTLDLVATTGKIIEVNTRGIYQKKTTTTYPSPWVLHEIRKRNIPVTISSDAHHPDDLVNRFPETARELLSIGFKKIRILLNGKWTDVSFSEHGISQPTT